MYSQACLLGQNQLKIVIIPDNYPSETSWNLKDQTGAIVLSGIINSDSICVPNNSCYTFTIIDSYGDGICCAFGNGSYKIYLNGVQVATGGQFTYQQSVDINCPQAQVVQQHSVLQRAILLPQPKIPGTYLIQLQMVCMKFLLAILQIVTQQFGYMTTAAAK